MTLSTKSDLVIDPYKPLEVPPAPTPEVSLLFGYVRSELSRIERIVNELAESTPQVADAAPATPRKGLIRYAVAPWNPGSGSNKWYYWTGAAWALL